jgi:hypothetical protein
LSFTRIARNHGLPTQLHFAAYTYRLAGKPSGIIDMPTAVKYAAGRGAFCGECFTGYETDNGGMQKLAPPHAAKYIRFRARLESQVPPRARSWALSLYFHIMIMRVLCCKLLRGARGAHALSPPATCLDCSDYTYRCLNQTSC